MTADDDEPQVIRPPDTLKAKVREGGPGAVDLAALERAEAVIANLTDSYLEWVQDDLAKFQNAFDRLREPGADRKAVAEEIFQISHDVKGQGGSFGYDLMTIVGNNLCRFIEGLKGAAPSDRDIEVIRLHIETMKLVIAKNLKGDGGPAGEQILKGLGLVVEKVSR